LCKSKRPDAYTDLLAFSQQASTSRNALARAGIDVNLATWLFENGQHSQAQRYVQEVLELTRLSGATPVMAQALILQARLASVAHDYARTDQSFESGLAMLEQLHMYEELIEYTAEYARIL